jgi:hypothetical protein
LPHPQRGKKIGIPHVAGKPLIKDRTYILASTDMEFSDWAGYLVIPDEQAEYEVPRIMPEVLEE